MQLEMTTDQIKEAMDELIKQRKQWISVLQKKCDEFYREQVMRRLDHIETCIHAINPDW